MLGTYCPECGCEMEIILRNGKEYWDCSCCGCSYLVNQKDCYDEGDQEMTTKLLNKINKKTNKFLCNRCGCDVGFGIIIKHKVYCMKCGDIIKGRRDEKGRLNERI